MSVNELLNAQHLCEQAHELCKHANAARLRADALHAWTRAIYKVCGYRLSTTTEGRYGQPIDETTTRDYVSSLLWTILDAAIAVTAADCGNVQIVQSCTGNLRIVAQRGFERAFLDYFDTVDQPTSASGMAMRAGHRIIVLDVRTSAAFSAGARSVMLDANARAVQATPVVDRSRSVIAMISTHFQTPHQPSEKQLQMLDALVFGAGPFFAATRERFFDLAIAGVSRISAAGPLAST